MGSSSSGKKRKRQRKKEEEDSNVNADAIPESSREIVQTMKEVVNCSEQEIYAMLVECNMDADEAITRLLSQDSFQEVKSKRDKKKETKNLSDSQRVGSSNQNCDLRNGGDGYLGEETSDVQGIHNPGPPLDRFNLFDVSNVETKRVPISSDEADPSLSVPSSRLTSALGCVTSSQRTMADVVKNGLGSLKESVTAPVKDLLPEKPVAPNLFSNSVESASRRDQPQESASVSNQNFRDSDDGGSQLLCDNDNNKNDETCQVQKCSLEHNQNGSSQLLCDNYNQTKDPSVPVNSDQFINELRQMRFGSFGSVMIGPGQPSGLPSQFLNDDSEKTSAFAVDLPLRHLNLQDGECHEEEEQQLKTNVANEQMAHQVNSDAPRSYHSSPYCDHTEPTQENQYMSSSATDFTFDISQVFNPVIAPSESVNTFPNAMHQQAYTRELNPWHSASPLIQSMPTASSLGRRLSSSMNEINRQTMNHHLYSQPNVPSGDYDNRMNYPCPLPTQNDTYDMPTSSFQQHGGSNNNAYHQPSIDAPLSLYRLSDLRQPAVAALTSTRSSAYGSTNGLAYGSAMLSHNTENSRFEHEYDFRAQFSNHLSSLQHQNGNSNMWTPQGHNDSRRQYRSAVPGHQNQQSLSFRHNQQQEERYRGIGNVSERNRRYYASLYQQNNRRGDPSNQIQQQHQWR
ncbi:uncharacterized protein LOC17876047 isoform X2 [Capsella rubella]|uniref:uncharacterized protein LOC17876047 isoform X2 n=1 Tax=Capsella rubella TaxID=81985 RepID=UPI000CD56FD3|nr:uncharacterized protein LOC17876047 isoform X2 [Capsella rubella]